MKIHHLQLGELRSNCYIIETAPGQCVAVDIGGDSRMLLNYLQMKHLRLSKILLTHGHYDHVGGVAETVAATDAEVYIHSDDANMLESAAASLASLMSVMPFHTVSKYVAVVGDSCISDGELTFRVMHTPGHTKGSVCYICDDVIFSGDTLFCCSIGRTDFPGGSVSEMRESLKSLVELEGDFKIYPGHNESSTLDYERKNNPYLVRL